MLDWIFLFLLVEFDWLVFILFCKWIGCIIILICCLFWLINILLELVFVNNVFVIVKLLVFLFMICWGFEFDVVMIFLFWLMIFILEMLFILFEVKLGFEVKFCKIVFKFFLRVGELLLWFFIIFCLMLYVSKFVCFWRDVWKLLINFFFNCCVK